MKRWIWSAGLVGFILGSAGVVAQEDAIPGLPDLGVAEPSPLAHDGAGVFHGNYCGLGDRGPGLRPADALDRACMHHDACTPEGGVPSCACNARFQRETHAVAVGWIQPAELRSLAKAVEAAIPLIPCH